MDSHRTAAVKYLKCYIHLKIQRKLFDPKTHEQWPLYPSSTTWIKPMMRKKHVSTITALQCIPEFSNLSVEGEILDGFANARSQGPDNGHQLSEFMNVHIVQNWLAIADLSFDRTLPCRNA